MSRLPIYQNMRDSPFRVYKMILSVVGDAHTDPPVVIQRGIKSLWNLGKLAILRKVRIYDMDPLSPETCQLFTPFSVTQTLQFLSSRAVNSYSHLKVSSYGKREEKLNIFRHADVNIWYVSTTADDTYIWNLDMFVTLSMCGEAQQRYRATTLLLYIHTVCDKGHVQYVWDYTFLLWKT